MNKDVMEGLYEQYYKELYLYAFSLSKSHYQAEELVSDTFYKAMLAIDGATGHFKFWLFTVCKNSWIDLLRKEKKLDKGGHHHEWLASKENVLNTILVNEKNKELYKAILSLPISYREAIIMHYYFDFSLKEISEALQIGNGAARTLLYRARLKLKKILEGGTYEF